MAIGSKVSGNFKSGTGLFAKVDGGWKKAQFGYVRVDGQWRQFWAADLKDAFSRADTTNSLGTAESGQAWNIVSSQWRINNGFANTTGAKTDYPLAVVDLGFYDFNAKANELSPGMGFVFNYTDTNNWWAVYPYYNQTSYQYSVCVSGRNESYCIANCSEPAGYNTVCFGTETPGTQTCVLQDVPTGCSERCTEPTTGCASAPFCTICYYVPGVTTCGPDRTETYDCCVRRCSTPTQTCTTDTVCIREDGITRCFPRQNCTTTYTTVCCDRDICTRTIPGECVTGPGDTVCGCECPITIPGQCSTVCTGIRTEQVCTTSPSTCSTGYQQVPYYSCCQSGTRFICEQSRLETAYNDYFYIRVVRKQNGTISVVSDTQVTERWNALTATKTANSITIKAFKDVAYTQQVGSNVTVASTSAATGYGILGAPSNYEDGRNIGSVEVKVYEA